MSNLSYVKHVQVKPSVKLPEYLKPQAMMTWREVRRDPYRQASMSVNNMAEAIRNLHHLSKADAAILIRAMASKMAGSVYSAAVVEMLDQASDECDKGDSLLMAGFAETDERKAAARRFL